MDSPSQPTPDIFGHAYQMRVKERLLRDPLHGLIAIDESTAEGRLLTRLVDSAEMQRLRRIRQLGLAHYAFQGAEHSRFTHSIGAYHLLGKVVDQLGRMYAIDSDLAFYARVAALVHDVGHGPFSHVSEPLFGAGHESWGVRILHDEGTDVHRALTDHSRQLPSIIESMLSGMAKPGYLCSLVSSQLDCDRLDYLLRDSLMTGVKYGVFDIDRLIHMLRISPDGDKVIVADGGLVPIEKYLQARYHMHRQVYLHKTVAAAEAMLLALLRRASALLREGGPIEIEPGGALARALETPEDLTVAEYLEIDDVEIMGQVKRWAKSKDPVLADLSRRLLHRRLFKTLEIDPTDPATEERMERVTKIVRDAGLDPRYYLLKTQSSDAPYRPYDPTSERTADHIYIENGKGGIVDVAEVSPTLQAFTQSAYTLTRLVFPETFEDIPIRERIRAVFEREGRSPR